MKTLKIYTEKCVDYTCSGHDEFREIRVDDGKHLFVNRNGKMFIAYRCLVCCSCPVEKELGECNACNNGTKPASLKNIIIFKK